MIGYTTFGSGSEGVVALHGWFGDHAEWDAMHPALDGNKFTFAFMDYRGYSLSREMTGDYSLDEIGRDALNLADHLGWEKFHVIGHSMGGMMTQWLAAFATDRVKSGVAVTPVPASGFPMDEAGWALFGGAADNVGNRAGIIGFTTGNRHNSAWMAWMAQNSVNICNRDAFAAYLNAWAKSDFSAQAKGKPTPLLVLPGEYDLAVTPDVMKATVLQYFPNAELLVIPNAGHYPMNETPIYLATQAQAFMEKHC